MQGTYTCYLVTYLTTVDDHSAIHIITTAAISIINTEIRQQLLLESSSLAILRLAELILSVFPSILFYRVYLEA